MDDRTAAPTPEARAVVSAARAALAGGALGADDLLARLAADGVIGRGDDAADDAMALLLDSGLVWVTADGATVVDHARRVGQAWFVHRLDAAEISTGCLALAPDLVALRVDVEDDTVLRLRREGTEGDAHVRLVVGDPFDADPSAVQLHGPDGWLAVHAPGDALAFRRVDDVLEVAPATARPGAGGREAELVRAAHDALAGDRPPVPLDAVVLEALAGNDHAFRRAVRPLVELLADAGLEYGGGYVGPAGTDVAAAAARRDAADMVRAMYGFEDCCADAFDLVCDALVAHGPDDAIEPSRALSGALAHGDVAAALVDVVDAWDPEEGLLALARFASAFAEQEGRARAGGALLMSHVLVRSGEPGTARLLAEEAVLADPGIDAAVEHLAHLVAVAGDLDGAIRLRSRLDLEEDRELEFLLALRPPRAHRAGRNDPCPCGSGRKFKACCLDKPVVLSPEHHELWLDDKLSGFASQPAQYFRIGALVMHALAPGTGPLAFLDSGLPASWLLYDDGLVDEFARRYRDALPEIERPMLDARRDAVRGLYEVASASRARHEVVLREVGTGAEHLVVDHEAARAMRPGHLVTAHVLAAASGGARFAGLPMLVPEEHRDATVALVASRPDARAVADWYRATQQPVSR